MPVAMKSCFNKIFLCIFVVSTCCFHLSVQQFDYGDYDFGFPGPIPNNRPGQSNLRVNNWLPPGQDLVFSRGGNNNVGRPFGNNFGNNNNVGPLGNNPAPPTMGLPNPAPATPSPAFFQCLQGCPTTSEYNPVCATNGRMYGNEQKFNCARGCGADIQIYRRSSCEGIVQMQRG